MDEITPTSYIIQQRLGLLKGTTAGEGAQFFLLSAQKEDQTFAELKGVDTFKMCIRDSDRPFLWDRRKYILVRADRHPR